MQTTHRLAYLCRQCVASLDVKLALGKDKQGVRGEGILYPVLNMNAMRVTQIPKMVKTFTYLMTYGISNSSLR